jgi:hypothetical protein
VVTTEERGPSGHDGGTRSTSLVVTTEERGLFRHERNNVRSVDVGRVGVCMVCVYDSEERERGMGAGVNTTILSETL